MGRSCGTHGGEEKRIQGLGWETWGTEATWTIQVHREDNIKLDRKETGWDCVDWIHMAQNRAKWSAIMNTVMYFPVSSKTEKFDQLRSYWFLKKDPATWLS